jgi:predicted nucleic acid-binding protein
MSAVSDTSPILGLAAIDCLELLHEQFGAVFIPPAVLAELKTETDFRGTVAIRQALIVGWLELKKVNNIPLVRALSLELDKGESEALALAADLSLEIIVMDEHDGSARARAMGLKPVGVIGICYALKKMGKSLPLRRLCNLCAGKSVFSLPMNFTSKFSHRQGNKNNLHFAIPSTKRIPS